MFLARQQRRDRPAWLGMKEEQRGSDGGKTLPAKDLDIWGAHRWKSSVARSESRRIIIARESEARLARLMCISNGPWKQRCQFNKLIAEGTASQNAVHSCTHRRNKEGFLNDRFLHNTFLKASG